MSDNYTTLADIYDQIGMAEFARQTMPRVLDYALQNDWLGRSVVDMGCGTGAAALWMADAGNYNVIGIDRSEEMLAIAQSKAESTMGSSLDWLQTDIRKPLDELTDIEMVVAFDVLNEMESLKDFQAVFTNAYQILRQDKLFVFDMHTIEGLTRRGERAEQIIHDDSSATVVARYDYDYERQTTVAQHISFARSTANESWQRRDTVRVLRAFPIKAIVGLLQRAGFDEIKLLNEILQPFGTRWGGLSRVIFVAWKK